MGVAYPDIDMPNSTIQPRPVGRNSASPIAYAIAILTLGACGTKAATPDRSANGPSARRGEHCRLPMISDPRLLRASDPSTLEPKDGETVRVVGRLRYGPESFAVRWPCHPVSDFAGIAPPGGTCVPEENIVVIEGRAQLPHRRPNVYEADGPSFMIVDYRMVAISDEDLAGEQWPTVSRRLR